LCDIAGKRIGRAEPQDLVENHDLPRIDDKGERKKQPRQRRVPAPLLGDDDLRRKFAFALLDRKLARGKTGGDLFARVFRAQLGAIGIDRRLGEGPPSRLPSQPSKVATITRSSRPCAVAQAR
jgi:hypothetical protein